MFSLKYCSHVWGGLPISTIYLLSKFQSKAIRLISNPYLTKPFQPHSLRCLVGDLLQMLSPGVLLSADQGNYSTSSEACQDHKKLDSFIAFLGFIAQSTNFYPTNHHSSQEYEIYGTSGLLLAFLHITTCNISNLRSINLTCSCSPHGLSLFRSSIVWTLCRPP